MSEVTDTAVAGEWGLGPPFSTKTRNFQTTWDSTSLGWLKDCPRLYYYQMIEGWAPQGYNIHLTFGSLYAYGVEHYARYRADHLTHDQATLGMMRAVLQKAGHRDPETDEWVPWDPPAGHPDANIKNRYTLIRSLVWNVEDRLSSPYQTMIKENGRPAVEESFNFYAFDIDDEPIHFAGHLDEVVEDIADKSLWVADDKTTKGPIEANYFRQYAPHNQVSLYSVAGKVVLKAPIKGVLIRAAQIGVTFTRFAARPIPRPPAVLDEWFNETQYWIGQAKSFAELDYWPMNDKSCGNFGGCPFIGVCSKSPSHRKAWLEDGFVKREWNPLVPRGE